MTDAVRCGRIIAISLQRLIVCLGELASLEVIRKTYECRRRVERND
jgi:hypothetical protein